MQKHLQECNQEHNLNKQMAEFRIPHFFNTSCTFWPDSAVLFQGTENRFHNSILSILHGNPAITRTFRHLDTQHYRFVTLNQWFPTWGAIYSAQRCRGLTRFFTISLKIHFQTVIKPQGKLLWVL